MDKGPTKRSKPKSHKKSDSDSDSDSGSDRKRSRKKKKKAKHSKHSEIADLKATIAEQNKRLKVYDDLRKRMKFFYKYPYRSEKPMADLTPVDYCENCGAIDVTDRHRC